MEKKQITLATEIRALDKLFNDLNLCLFNDELEKPILTIQNAKGSYGWITIYKTWTDGTGGYYEINISADYMNRTRYEIIGTMVHEMVHLYNLMKGIKDTSRGYRYHNKRFKEKAESVGLIISHDNSIGWSITKIGPELAILADLLSFGGFGIQKGGIWKEPQPEPDDDDDNGNGNGNDNGNGNGGTAKPPKRPSSTRKYTCPTCKTSVRATKDVYIICGNCEEKMEKEEA